MRAVVLLVVGLLASASAFGEIVKNYHELVGIPHAAKIKAYEESVMSSRNVVGRHNRIVGGSVAPDNAHPYLTGLLASFDNFQGQSACSSTLVSSTRVLTAAHCWFDGWTQASSFEVVLGSSWLFFGGTRISTSTVVMHPQWNPALYWNDIAVIYLPASVEFTESIMPIALPSASDLSESFAGQWAVTAGYGMTSDSETGVSTTTRVSHVDLQVISITECQSIYGTVAVLDSTLCTSGVGGIGICFGDSGGPLVIQRNGVPTLIGTSSFLFGAGCERGFPSGFARTTSFYNFIQQHL